MYEDRGIDRPQVQPSIQQNGAIESSVLLPRLEEKAASSLLKSFFYLWEVTSIMMTLNFVNAVDFPGDSTERETLALNLKEGLCPEQIFSDWGDFDGDYSTAAHDRANGVAVTCDEFGMRFASAKEVQTYYDSLNPDDIEIQILERKK
jgi:hypothetical protein